MVWRVSRIIALIAILSAGTIPAALAAPVTIERIVAKVDQHIITLSELQDFVREEVEKIRKAYKGEEFERRRRELELQGLDALIESKLILQRAKAMSLTVNEQELEQAVSAVTDRTKLTAEELRRQLRAEGITLEAYREKMRERLLQRKAESLEVDIRVSVSEEEVAAFYQANADQFREGEARRVRQIFFPVREGASQEEVEEKRRKAEEAHKAATLDGADFAEVAKKLSEGPAASGGGDLGFIKKGEVFPELEAIVFTQPPGEVGRPTRTRVGFHVIRVVETQPGKVITLDRVAGKVRDQLFAEKRAKRRREWIAELKRASFLEVNFEPQASRANGGLEALLRDVREQVTFRLVRVQLLESAEILGRERLFWAYGSNQRDPRWKSDKLKVDEKLILESEEIGSLEKTHREFINPDPSASLFLYEHNFLLPNVFLGKVSFADVIKEFSLKPQEKRLVFLTDSKKARLEFEVRVEKTRSIVADPKEISQ